MGEEGLKGRASGAGAPGGGGFSGFPGSGNGGTTFTFTSGPGFGSGGTRTGFAPTDPQKIFEYVYLTINPKCLLLMFFQAIFRPGQYVWEHGRLSSW